MKQVKNKNMLVLVVIVIVTLTSSIGYSALQSNLKITADLSVLKDYIPDGTLYDMMHHISEMDNTSSKYVSSPSGIDFSEVSSDTNGKGVYELYTTKDEKYPIHYYRGEVDNNVIFANFCWKIVRTTETGGIRLIYNGEPSGDGKCDNNGDKTEIGTLAYNENSDDAKYVGYKYDNDTVDSTVKEYIDSWYEENIENKKDSKGASYSTYLDDSFFCNDRSISSRSGNTIYYSSYTRNAEDHAPSLACAEEDKFTISSGKLTYPVGLITLDELAYAGGEYNDTTSKFYLRTGRTYWTMSPYYFNGVHSFVGLISPEGIFHNRVVYDERDVRPVVSLKHDTKYLSGNGTKDTPFLITPITRSLYNVIKTNSVLDNAKSEYVESETGIDFSQISSDTNGKGVYELHTTVTDKYPIYYYRGAVTDNNIIFANFCWKIIRTTSSGGIKIIYTGSPTSDNKCTNTTDSNTQIGTSAYNSDYDEAKYVGYKYDNDEVDSTIKTKVDSWYKTNIDEKKDASGKSYTNYIEDLEFCNDRSSKMSGSNYFYGAFDRNYGHKTPSLICPQDEDKFTVANEKLTYPVGLITVDEVAYAGGVHDTSNSTYYLYTNQWHWTMSPSYFQGGAEVWGVSSVGGINNYYVNSNNGVRPILSLISTTQVIGTGTSDDPYIVVEN